MLGCPALLCVCVHSLGQKRAPAVIREGFDISRLQELVEAMTNAGYDSDEVEDMIEEYDEVITLSRTPSIVAIPPLQCWCWSWQLRKAMFRCGGLL